MKQKYFKVLLKILVNSSNDNLDDAKCDIKTMSTSMKLEEYEDNIENDCSK